MSLGTMIADMRGDVPKYSAILARTHIREAWLDVRNMRGWSFQLGNGGFGTPGLINGGTCSVDLGGTDVTPDATALPLWLAGSTNISLITQRQFRVGAGTIYNIVAMDSTSGFITLDRPFIDTSYGSGLGYSIYQCYYAVPVDDFEAWESILDINNVIWLNTTPSRGGREWADEWDPQRQVFENPQAVLPYGTDQRVGSPTFGRMMYELYPQPQSQYAYQTWYSRAGADLVNPSDTLPYPITDHVVRMLARVKAYEWAEANKDPMNPRGHGADFRFLIGAAAKEAAGLLHEIRMLDRDRVDMWKSTMTRIAGLGPVATFDPSTGRVMSRNC